MGTDHRLGGIFPQHLQKEQQISQLRGEIKEHMASGYPVSILVNFGQPSCTGFSCNPSAYCDLISGVPTCICRSPLFQEVSNDANGPVCGFIALMLLIAAGICCSFCERRRTAKFRLLENVAEEDKEQGRLSAEVQSTHF
ncbi:hypothetical protein AAHC03_09115 [Spirometra sp. Aus1]